MTQHNVGALVVVKPGEEKAIAGIVTERGNCQSKLIFAGCKMVRLIELMVAWMKLNIDVKL